ncbi:hypothetical protein [Chitinophaga caseinilytica]|uniref:Uncharacterized protein n=1 Tax=Chitinophaga caseinilytica TaxID=2267521 RepID=A0ABZ2Z806_9BACT
MKKKTPKFYKPICRWKQLENVRKRIEEEDKDLTPEEAFKSLYEAGLIDENGNEPAWMSDPANFTMRFLRR